MPPRGSSPVARRAVSPPWRGLVARGPLRCMARNARWNFPNKIHHAASKQDSYWCCGRPNSMWCLSYLRDLKGFWDSWNLWNLCDRAARTVHAARLAHLARAAPEGLRGSSVSPGSLRRVPGRRQSRKADEHFSTPQRSARQRRGPTDGQRCWARDAAREADVSAGPCRKTHVPAPAGKLQFLRARISGPPRSGRPSSPASAGTACASA